MNIILPCNESQKLDYISTLDLRTMINEARELAGKAVIRNTEMIRKVEDELEGELAVAEILQPPQGGTPQRFYNITYRQAMLVAMRESKAVRRAVVDKLERLENAVRRPKFNLPQTYHEALRALADESEKNLELTRKIQEDAPKVEFAEDIMHADSSITFEQFAKLYKPHVIGRNTLFRLLRGEGVLRQNNIPYQKYMKYFELREFIIEINGRDRIKTQTLINPSGQVFITNLLNNILPENNLTVSQAEKSTGWVGNLLKGVFDEV